MTDVKHPKVNSAPRGRTFEGVDHYERTRLAAHRRWRAILQGRKEGSPEERALLFKALGAALMRYDRDTDLNGLSDVDRLLHEQARAIIEARVPWPKDLLRWKTLRELRYYHGEADDTPEPPWCIEENMTPGQRRHQRNADAAFDRWADVIRAPKLRGETEKQKDARAAKAGPWPYPEYGAHVDSAWKASVGTPKLAGNERRRRKV